MNQPRTDYTASEFYKKIHQELDIDYKDQLILVCAILIASIGLNMNSIPTVIGAMLISPLMTPILGMGVGASVYSVPLFKKAMKLFLIEVAISLGISTVYFFLSPISYASEQLIARTSPTIWDVFIAFIGGLAGIIGAQKKGANNIVPGVAIATALMPPLCTVGYAISQGNQAYFFGATYLFLINVVFILLATIVGMTLTSLSKKMRAQNVIQPTYQRLFLLAIVLFSLPSLFSAGRLVSDSYRRLTVNQVLSEQLPHQTILSRQYNASTNRLTLLLYGDSLSSSEQNQLEEELHRRGLEKLQVEIHHLDKSGSLSVEEILELLGKDGAKRVEEALEVEDTKREQQ